ELMHERIRRGVHVHGEASFGQPEPMVQLARGIAEPVFGNDLMREQQIDLIGAHIGALECEACGGLLHVGMRLLGRDHMTLDRELKRICSLRGERRENLRLCS
ncbi:MAG TPA: hypothetical protein VGG28_20865, partial [Kofleriaceae bacterium]